MGIFEKVVRDKTGLSIQPYFSATKILWILNHVKSARKLAAAGKLAFGTVDTWVMWNLLKDSPHVTDYTNASRTILFDIHKLSWDQELLDIFNIPKNILPEVKNSRADFGVLQRNILNYELPIKAVCGDQQASMFAAGEGKGLTKITYGTGTFVSQSLGSKFFLKKDFFTTLIPSKSEPHFALEAKINDSAKNVAPLLDNPKRLKKVLDKLASDTAKIVRKLPIRPKQIIVDGGISQSDYLVVKQEKVLNIDILRQKTADGTALGIAKLLK